MAWRIEDHRWNARPDLRLVRAVQPVVRALTRRHPTRVLGLENLPRGPALLVGNHGMLGYECPFFFEGLLSTCGRLPLGLADRWFFSVPGVRDLLVRLGGAYGSARNGLSMLRRGELVVCYPGGAREVFKREDQKYRCLWHRSLGFVRLALQAGVPIVPFAAAGVDDTFHVVTHLRGSGELLMGARKYDLPLVSSLLPKPVPFWFRLGEPIMPPHGVRANDPELLGQIHREVWDRTQGMVDDLVGEWRSAA